MADLNYQTAKLDPMKYFQHPNEVLKVKNFTDEAKREILHQWAYDINELQVAEEENMGPNLAESSSNHAQTLQAIHKALAELGEEMDETEGGVTKHGT